MDNTALFIGHSRLNNYEQLIPLVDQSIQELFQKGYTTFLCGGYGTFDLLCAERLFVFKRQHPQLESILVHPYPKPHLHDTAMGLFDRTLYPGLEDCPPRFAIPLRNRWMVKQSQAALCYVTHDWGGAAQTLDYALRTNLLVINLAISK